MSAFSISLPLCPVVLITPSILLYYIRTSPLTQLSSVEPLRNEVRTAFAKSLRVIWLVLIPFGGIGLLLALFMREIKLETVTDEVRLTPFPFQCNADLDLI